MKTLVVETRRESRPWETLASCLLHIAMVICACLTAIVLVYFMAAGARFGWESAGQHIQEHGIE